MSDASGSCKAVVANSLESLYLLPDYLTVVVLPLLWVGILGGGTCLEPDRKQLISSPRISSSTPLPIVFSVSV